MIEIVDTDERLRSFVNSLAEFPDIGLVTMETVEVLRMQSVKGAG